MPPPPQKKKKKKIHVFLFSPPTQKLAAQSLSRHYYLAVPTELLIIDESPGCDHSDETY